MLSRAPNPKPKTLKPEPEEGRGLVGLRAKGFHGPERQLPGFRDLGLRVQCFRVRGLGLREGFSLLEFSGAGFYSLFFFLVLCWHGVCRNICVGALRLQKVLAGKLPISVSYL